MIGNLDTKKVYTPEQVAELLQLSKNTVYELIAKGEIPAKKLGKVYRVPAISLSFLFTGLDYDFYTMEQEDLKNMETIERELKSTRKKLFSS